MEQQIPLCDSEFTVYVQLNCRKNWDLYTFEYAVIDDMNLAFNQTFSFPFS